MFTGIVEETGRVKKITQQAGLTRLEVSARQVLSDTKIGDSIAVNGVCLTAVAITNNALSFDIMLATLKNTNLGLLRLGQLVNLERSLKLGERVSGHFVCGHIDCLGLVRSRILRQGSAELKIAVEPAFMRYCLPKGSVAVDGISLTIAAIKGNVFTVGIIPHTLKSTALSFTKPSDKLNLEFDILAKRAAV